MMDNVTSDTFARLFFSSISYASCGFMPSQIQDRSCLDATMPPFLARVNRRGFRIFATAPVVSRSDFDFGHEFDLFRLTAHSNRYRVIAGIRFSLPDREL